MTFAQAADQNLRQMKWLQRQWRRVVAILLPIASLIRYFRENPELWRERPDIRSWLLANIIWMWGEAWIVIAIFTVLLSNYSFLMPYFGVVFAGVVAVLSFFVFGRGRPAVISAATITVVVGFWLILINVYVLSFRNTRNLPWFLDTFVSGNLSVIGLGFWGLFWLLVIYGVMLFMPIWKIEIKPGEIFLVDGDASDSEGFRLYSRPNPRVDNTVIEMLISKGVSESLIRNYIHFNGPKYMQKSLINQLGPDADRDARQALGLLFQQTADRSRKDPPILWVSAMDQERLFWDRKNSVSIPKRSEPGEPEELFKIPQLITKDGHPIEIEVKFSCSFDPEAAESPEFYTGFKNLKGKNAVEGMVRAVTTGVATGQARLFFIDLPLRSALTSGTIQNFRDELPQLMSGLRALGITVSPQSVQCRPVLHPDVEKAEIEMLASRPGAIAQTARVQELIEKVMLHGVPPDLLGGLLFLDQSTTGENKAFQMNSNTDVIPLPDPTREQTARQLYRKFQGDIPQELIPRLPVPNPPPASLPPPSRPNIIELPPKSSQDQLPTPPDQQSPKSPDDKKPPDDNPPRGPRFTTNLGDKRK